MNQHTICFAQQVADLSPASEVLLHEHVADNDEILPYVFLADVARRLASMESGDRRKVVAWLERAFQVDQDDVKNLIAVGFVEHYATQAEFEVAVNGVRAEALRAEWMRQHA